MSFWPYLVAIWIALWGLYGIVTSRHMVHLTISLSVFQSATYVLLLAIGYHRGGTAPIFKDQPAHPAVDPIVQALVLTDIVVTLTSTALLLALTIQAQKRFATVDPQEIREMRG